MGAPIDLTNQVFGDLVALTPTTNEKGIKCWNCSCKCGNIAIVRTAGLRSGDNVSCGCRKTRVLIYCKTCNIQCKKIKSRIGKFCSHKCYWIDRIGRQGWNKGMKGQYTTSKKGRKFCPLTEEHKQKIRKSTIGKKKNRSYPKGENHPNWKGGTYGTERHRLMTSTRYKNLVKDIFKRDNYTCKICNESGKYLNMDHIKKWSEYPELRFEMSNCRTLCRECHFLITFGHKMPEDSHWGITKNKFREEV